LPRFAAQTGSLHAQQLPGSSLPAQYDPGAEHIMSFGSIKQAHPPPVD